VTPGLLQSEATISIWRFLGGQLIDQIHSWWLKPKNNSIRDDIDQNSRQGGLEAGIEDTQNQDNQKSLDPQPQRIHFLARFFVALVSVCLLIAPVAVLSYQSTRKVHLITLAVSTCVFSFLLSFVSSKASLQETVVAVAGYSAVLVVFVAVATNS
jgi:lipopolysaccharide export LptBFGC system permease protein LptF